MKQSELIELELGNYKLTDDIYHYYLEKKLDSKVGVIYQIKEILMGGTLTIFTEEDNQLSASMSVGGIHLHAKGISFAIRNLKLVKE